MNETVVVWDLETVPDLSAAVALSREGAWALSSTAAKTWGTFQHLTVLGLDGDEAFFRLLQT
jgi:hypothetical protein